MPKTAIVTLADPLKGHGADIGAVKLREPTGMEFIALGEPMVIARNQDGTMYSIEYDDKIREYVEKCTLEPDPLLLKQMSLRDGMAVKAALLDFFQSARAAT